ncbi:MAG: GNAT family N-acetyltransferase [Bacteroidia bacterium]|nr:GNAT family N-acetyltransferase [Bacteroidia bacterium]MDG2041439.1 GNAT family N-acetyltransferase [Bacteroidia bacterium]
MCNVIRKANATDIPSMMKLIVELAIYERAPNEVTNTEQMMLKDGFGDNPLYHAFVADIEGEIIGFAITYYRYSTWKGRCLYLEDLIVTENYRNKGIGQKLFDYCLSFGKKNSCEKIIWQVLDWNQPAINFYNKNNAQLDNSWINGSLSL